MVEKVKNFIQKEFKKVTGSSLSLTDPSEIDVLVEYISRIRTSVKAHKCWKISSSEVEDNYPESEDHSDPVSAATRKWIEQGKAAKKPSNIKI